MIGRILDQPVCIQRSMINEMTGRIDSPSASWQMGVDVTSMEKEHLALFVDDNP